MQVEGACTNFHFNLLVLFIFNLEVFHVQVASENQTVQLVSQGWLNVVTGPHRQMKCERAYVWVWKAAWTIGLFLIRAQNLWQPVTVAFLFWIPNLFFFLSVFSYDEEKTATAEATSCFLTWSFLSRIVIEIYIYMNIHILLYFSVIKSLLCSLCVVFDYKCHFFIF